MSCAGVLPRPHDTESVILYSATDGAQAVFGRVSPRTPRFEFKRAVFILLRNHTKVNRDSTINTVLLKIPDALSLADIFVD